MHAMFVHAVLYTQYKSLCSLIATILTLPTVANYEMFSMMINGELH